MTHRRPPGAARVGTHVAVGARLIRGGLKEAAETGAEVIQFFVGNPRSWAPLTAEDRVKELAFRVACDRLDVEVVVHAPHLINLGLPVPLVAERSSALLAAVMRRAARLGATAVVFHAGSSLTAQYRARALRQVRHATARLLAEAPTGVDLLVEPTAGGGAALASTILWDEARSVPMLCPRWCGCAASRMCRSW
jgi:deoxyribonuclease IV